MTKKLYDVPLGITHRRSRLFFLATCRQPEHEYVAVTMLASKCLKVKVCKDHELKQSEPNTKREIIVQNTKRTHGQPSEQHFPKGGHPNRSKNNMNTRKMKRHRNPDIKNRQQIKPQQNHRLGTVTACVIKASVTHAR